MKITNFIHDNSAAMTSGVGAGAPIGGDLGGNQPTPQVVGIGGVPISATPPAAGQVPTYDSGSGTIIWETPAATGLSSVTDGVTTVSPASSLTVPGHSLTNLGGGDAELAYVTPTYGGQEVIHTVAASGAATTLNPSAGNVHDVTLTAACTISLGTGPASGACGLTIILRQDGTGGRLVTWPGSVSWIGGTAPVLKTAPAGMDVITLFSVDGGTTWGGAYLSQGTVVTTGSGEILMQDGVTAPPVPIETEARDDWLYAG